VSGNGRETAHTLAGVIVAAVLPQDADVATACILALLFLPKLHFFSPVPISGSFSKPWLLALDSSCIG
jgi:hypothetical protein